MIFLPSSFKQSFFFNQKTLLTRKGNVPCLKRTNDKLEKKPSILQLLNKTCIYFASKHSYYLRLRYMTGMSCLIWNVFAMKKKVRSYYNKNKFYQDEVQKSIFGTTKKTKKSCIWHTVLSKKGERNLLQQVQCNLRHKTPKFFLEVS